MPIPVIREYSGIHHGSAPHRAGPQRSPGKQAFGILTEHSRKEAVYKSEKQGIYLTRKGIY
ncbi:hypothetical protein B1222_05155 [Paenibacillus larvae subsp. pulvifaciens]|nr:hypothetical protein B1222_05155 [Paenibacillus larvae subsp. pulvifaciens]AQZ45374.1 hypothetical protein B5S25_00975 [Paenibacillus larvae subsp. pulvifaciens]MBH0343406.1 hypothetical protein [Paenibacillus larvae]